MRSVLFTLCLLFSLNAFAQKKVARPNVIFIMADDLGRGLLSYYGQKIIKTPGIDRLANEGVVFENAYAGAFCAPSRAGFLTGYMDCSPGKFKLTEAGVYTGVAQGRMSDREAQARVDQAIGIEPHITYLPQVFKKAGYVTGQIGKLEYGFVTTTKQMQHHGWDYWYGYYDHQQCHGFYPMYLHETGKMIRIAGNDHPDAAKHGEWGDDESNKKRRDREGKAVYAPDLFLRKSLAFIRKNKGQPFFLYHSTQLPHGPVSVPAVHPDFAFNDSLTRIEKEYASMVKRLDDDVAAIMKQLEASGIAENTIVIFSSDNGHELYYSLKGRVEKPYRNMRTGELFDDFTNVYYSNLSGDVFDGNDGMAGLKRSNYEGGVRVPLFVYWPKRFKSNVVKNAVVGNYDFLTTMADMLNVRTGDAKHGVSYYPILTGNKTYPGHSSIAFSTHQGGLLVTKDGWKLRHFAPKNVFQLYYLPTDYREEQDLADQYPKKAEELKKILTAKCDGDLNNGWFRDRFRIIHVN